jgi:5'-phosphate synthase pdxT subunit
VSSPVVGVLALQGDVREHQLALAALGAAAPAVRSAAELPALDGLVIPGGESTTISMLAVRWGVMEPLREAVAAGLPVYGSCAGMILLADTILDGRAGQAAIGGIDMVVRRNAFGRQVDSFEADVAIAGIAGPPVRAVFIRAPWVESVGAGVQVLARVPGSGHVVDHRAGPGAGAPLGDRIVAVRAGNLLATSFHPELTGDHRVHGLFVDIVRAARPWQPQH